jgi:hypothetical protein
MVKKQILLGYEVGTGKEICIGLSHLVVTGITEKSGKTTTLNALIKRSELKAIMFKTKGDERAITSGTITPPYFREKSDWQYVSSLLEATLKEKLKFERSWIMEVCKGTNSLIEVKNNIDEKLATGKLNSLSRSVYITLQEYFKLILPQLQTTVFSNFLELREGINVMDLEHFSDEIQSLVIRSVLETVLKEHRGVIVVIPEFWKFAHQKRGNPVKETAEQFIRQGATKNDYLWADSQDMANVDKTLLKQVFTWILGLQTERNEVQHTLDQLPLPKNKKPKTDEIMTLKLGHFYLASPEQTAKVYVLPSWITDKGIGKQIAMGKKDVSELEQPKFVAPYTILPSETIQISEKTETSENWKDEVSELRADFFARLREVDKKLEGYTKSLAEEIFKLRSSNQKINIDEIVAKVTQKIPISSGPASQIAFNKEELINEILSRIPKQDGSAVYQVAPLEKIKKDFLEKAKQKIIADVSSLDEEQKKILKFVETQGKGCNQSNILGKCLYLSTTSGGTRERVSNKCKEMANLELTRMDKNAVVYPNLRERITALIGIHEAKPEEIEQVYNYILVELLGK